MSESNERDPEQRVPLPSLEEVVRLSPVAAVALDRLGRVTMWSPAAERLFGWAEEEVLGKPNPMIPQEGFEEYIAELHARLAGERDDHGMELRRRRKDGEWVEVVRWATPIRDQDGALIGSLGLLWDVTDRERADRAEQENRAKSDLLSRASHDLRTPLNAILGFAQLLEMEDLGAVARGHVSEILRAGQELLRLVDEILEVGAGNPPAVSDGPSSASRAAASPEGGPLVLHIEDNEANRVLMEQILAFRPDIRLLSAGLGREGIASARRERPNLVLLDLHLPDMPGEEVLARLRQDPETGEVPVVVISADATDYQASRLREAGATAYLTKPFDVRSFLEMVDRLTT